MSLTYSDKVRINHEVALGHSAPADESPEASTFRQGITADFADATAKGIMLDLPSDWDDDAASDPTATPTPTP